MSLNGHLVYDWDRQLIMNDERLTTIEQVKQFLNGSKTLRFEGVSIEERCRWIESVVVRFTYHRLNRAEKGAYHINAVDEVAQWEIIATLKRISEYHLEPVLESMLARFPFVILGFHSHNDSEFINRVVAKLLNKLFAPLHQEPALPQQW